MTVSLDHYFDKFSFEQEEAANLQEIKKRFADQPEHLRFDLSSEPDYQQTREYVLSQVREKDQKTYDYYKFVKLVSHTFVDSIEVGHERDYQTWSYSLT